MILLVFSSTEWNTISITLFVWIQTFYHFVPPGHGLPVFKFSRRRYNLAAQQKYEDELTRKKLGKNRPARVCETIKGVLSNYLSRTQVWFKVFWNRWNKNYRSFDFSHPKPLKTRFQGLKAERNSSPRNSWQDIFQVHDSVFNLVPKSLRKSPWFLFNFPNSLNLKFINAP